jgi:hypothetical protein
MNKNVDLICLVTAKDCVSWPLGKVWFAEPTPVAIHALLPILLHASDAQAFLFWDLALGSPNPECVQEALSQPVDVWHAGLCLGMGGLPGLIDFLHPTWMLNRDPSVDIQATSWRLSLQACLVRIEVLRQMGGVSREFQTLAGAALEMGHRYLASGVLIQHVPWLISENAQTTHPILPFEDELRFVHARFGHYWRWWVLLRTLMTRYASYGQVICAWQRVQDMSFPTKVNAFQHKVAEKFDDIKEARVSVLIPTLDRYSYLRVLLDQLRYQTIKPLDIIVVDQTPLELRDTSLIEDFGDLPLKLLYRQEAGQCSSTNSSG